MGVQPQREPKGHLQSIWRNRDVVLLWAAQLVSQFGDYIFYVAILWLALEVTGDNGQAGLVAMCIHLPMIALGLLSGSLVDRWDRRRTMIAADAARCGLLLLFPLLHGAGALGVLTIAALAFAVESFTSLFNPARDVLIPELTPAPQLATANSLVQSAGPIAMVAGPAVAGALIPLVGLAHLFTVDAVTFALSMLFLLAIRGSGGRPRGERQPQGRSLPGDIAEGVRHAARDPVIRWLLLITAVDNWFIMGPAIIGMPIFIREAVGEPAVLFGANVAPAQLYALTITAYAVGYILCSSFIGRLPRRLSRGRVLLIGIFLDGATWVPLAWLSDPTLILALMLIHGMAVPPIIVMRTSMVQELVPEGMRGRVFAMTNLTVLGVTALTIGAFGFLTKLFPVNLLFGVYGGAAALLGPLGWMASSLRDAGGRPATAAREMNAADERRNPYTG